MRRNQYIGQPGTTAAAVVTATTAHITITAAVASNPTAANESLSAWIVPDGGTASDANKLINDKSISASEDGVGLPFLVAQTINPGNSLFLSASTADAITVTISGDEHS